MTLYGKESVIKQLSDASKAERFPHSVLFFGEEGVGRKTLAEYYAKASLCTEKNDAPCGNCPSCHKAENKVHPDIIYVKEMSEGEKYKIEALRGEIRRAALRPNDGDARVLIFTDIDTMPPQCQNTLLKFIEEPEAYNRFAFTAISDRNILPTVRSRLTAIKVPPMSYGNCLAALAEHSVPENEARELIETFGTSPGVCLKNRGNEPPLEYTIANSALRALYQRDEYRFGAALAKIKKRETLTETLLRLTEILRDSLFCQNIGRTATPLTEVYSEKQLRVIISMLERYNNEADSNPNIALATTAYSSAIFAFLEKK